jgi:hypothetical protein
VGSWLRRIHAREMYLCQIDYSKYTVGVLHERPHSKGEKLLHFLCHPECRCARDRYP